MPFAESVEDKISDREIQDFISFINTEREKNILFKNEISYKTIRIIYFNIACLPAYTRCTITYLVWQKTRKY